VNLYEVGGFVVDPSDPDSFNVYNDPSWAPLLELAEQKTDLIRMVSPTCRRSALWAHYVRTEERLEGRCRFRRSTLRVQGHEMVSRERRDADIDTVWHLEHFLKNEQDVEAFLEIPDAAFDEEIDVSPLRLEEQMLGDRGIVMVDSPDPLCMAAELFSMSYYLELAFTEQELFHKLLAKLARPLYARTEAVAQAFPGHLFRIVGSEYAAEPFLPPRLFRDYEYRYTRPMVEIVQRYGGFVRLHCHGRTRNVLPIMREMRMDAVDPLEPPPQGDVSLDEARRAVGDDVVLFGNIELNLLETLSPEEFSVLVRRTVEQGRAAGGRGFVLMPTAAPCGREVSARTLENYRVLVDTALGIRH
jgi:hypothetical protein